MMITPIASCRRGVMAASLVLGLVLAFLMTFFLTSPPIPAHAHAAISKCTLSVSLNRNIAPGHEVGNIVVAVDPVSQKALLLNDNLQGRQTDTSMTWQADVSNVDVTLEGSGLHSLYLFDSDTNEILCVSPQILLGPDGDVTIYS